MKNWKTSVLGGLVIATGIFGAINDPRKATDMQTISQMVGGLGLLLAKDHDVTGGKRKQEVDR